MQQLSLIQMFLGAGPTVKFVMTLLLLFSSVSWYIIFSKHLLYKKTRDESEKFIALFWKSKNLAEAQKISNEAVFCPEAIIFSQGYGELQKLGKSRAAADGEETLEMRLAGMENLKRTLRKAEEMELSRLSKSLSFLATTGSATPFIGLFGTVWGIMSSFQEIGSRGSASLAVVAPGISEALVATAAGLAVAIPAVIFFNYYTNIVIDIENKMSAFAADFLNLVERDMISKH